MPGLKKWKQTIIFMILLFMGSGFYAQAQAQSASNQLSNKLNAYSAQSFGEKIFAHTDKSFYVCGEILWFKLYNADAYFNKPSAISKVAYVELLNNKKQPVLQAKVELDGGTGSGSFMLPFSLNSDAYILRVYTNWMKNFSPDFFFESQLTIVNTLKKVNYQQSNLTPNTIQFFPEGGNLVNSLQSKVAFHAVDQMGRGIVCKGIITDQHNDSITSFKTAKFGMGNFDFTPQKDFTYKAIVQTITGDTIISELPAAYESGYVMKMITQDKNNIRVLVKSNSKNDEPVFLIVHTRQVIKSAQSKLLNNGTAEFIINKSELGEGVSHFTLFNNKQQPVCERLFFQPPKEKLNINITTDKQEYSVRKEIIINFNTHNTGKPITKADFSLSVFKTDSIQAVPEFDIKSYFWLSSELRGNIESPGYYFNSSDSDVEKVTDNLMLTQGWSRFKWEDVLSNSKPLFRFLPEYEGPVIVGKISERSSGLAAKNVSFNLTVPGEKFHFKTSTSDQNGNILFSLNKFYGSNEMIFQQRDSNAGSYNINILKPFAEDVSSRRYPPFHIAEKWHDQLLSFSIGTQVENVYVQEKKQQFYLPALTDTTAFYGTPDKRYLLDDYTRFITMEEVLREYVVEVRVRKQQDQFNYKVYNSTNKLFFDGEPLVLLDGLPVFDVNKLMDFDPLKIKRLDVVTKKYFHGNNAYEGIVSYSTYKGNLDGFQINPNALVLEYPGLQPGREFYSPLYNTKEQIESRIPDFRNVLYWSPYVTLNEKGNGEITLYTSDKAGKYAVVAQGISSNGVSGSEVVFFTVTK